MKKNTVLSIAIAIVLLMSIGAYLYCSPFPVTQRKAEQMAFSDFEANRDSFRNIAQNASQEKNILDGLLGLDHVRDIAVPDALANIGIDSVYAVNDGVYFEYSKSIMGVTPFGILQTKDA